MSDFPSNEVYFFHLICISCGVTKFMSAILNPRWRASVAIRRPLKRIIFFPGKRYLRGGWNAGHFPFTNCSRTLLGATSSPNSSTRNSAERISSEFQRISVASERQSNYLYRLTIRYLTERPPLSGELIRLTHHQFLFLKKTYCNCDVILILVFWNSYLDFLLD